MGAITTGRGGIGAALGIVVTGVLGGGCLDLLGHQENVTQHSDSQGVMRLEDDRIEDKHPGFDPTRLVTEPFGSGHGCLITLNKSATVTKLDVVPFEGADAALKGRLFRGRSEALSALAAISGADTIPSMEAVNGALKPFNDGLYAAVELQAEDGKRRLLATLAARLGTLRASAAPAGAQLAIADALVLVGTAQKLGGGEITIEASLQSRADAAASAFSANAALARPIGFYTWSQELERIFTRDRFLQHRAGDQPFGAFAALAWVLGQDPALLADYQQVAALYAGLTNPFTSHTLDELVPYVASVAALANPAVIEAAFTAAHPPRKICGGTLVAFLPASRSKEVDYFDSQFCEGIPDGTNLLDAFIEGVRSGAVDLAPAADSGWYDYQLYALETMLLPERGPESQYLLLTAGYKKKLIDTFKSLLIQARETHVKQLDVGARAASLTIPPADVYPLLPAEPFPTYYLRTARGYRFLRTFLGATLGPEFLGATRRVQETGDRGALSLDQELQQRIAVLYGLYFASADAIGMAYQDGDALLAGELAEIDVDAALGAARAWLAGWKTDADVVRDPRVIIPVSDPTAPVTVYWAVVGVKVLPVRAEFVAGHEPQVGPAASCWSGKFVPHRYTLLVEETAELRLPSGRPPPTRAELRAICDAHPSKDEIVAALGSR